MRNGVHTPQGWRRRVDTSGTYCKGSGSLCVGSGRRCTACVWMPRAPTTGPRVGPVRSLRVGPRLGLGSGLGLGPSPEREGADSTSRPFGLHWSAVLVDLKARPKPGPNPIQTAPIGWKSCQAPRPASNPFSAGPLTPGTHSMPENPPPFSPRDGSRGRTVGGLRAPRRRAGQPPPPHPLTYPLLQPLASLGGHGP